MKMKRPPRLTVRQLRDLINALPEAELDKLVEVTDPNFEAFGCAIELVSNPEEAPYCVLLRTDADWDRRTA